jgi:TatD DNase family protein
MLPYKKESEMFVDTHCHLNMMVAKKFNEPLKDEHFVHIQDIISRAHAAGVKRILNVGTSLAETHNSLALASRFSSVSASAGIHPCDAQSDWRKEFKEIKKLVAEHERHDIKAVGETGLDFYHKPFDRQRQVDCFKAHIELALEHDLPLVIHVRDATDATLRVLEEYVGQARGVNHCFVHDLDFARTMLSWGFYFGMDGPIGYPRNKELRATIAALPLDRLILETDAPFLPPQQFRGKQNSPEYIPFIAGALALARETSIDTIEKETTKNAQLLFNL